MMTDEELSLLRDAVDLFDKLQDNLVREALAHIDEQAKLIQAYRSQNIRYYQEKEQLEKDLTISNHRYLDLQQVCDDQAKQIATLKAALISEISDQYDSDETKSAKTKSVEQLAQEYPDIFKEE